jgi:pyruvate,water dikinase
MAKERKFTSPHRVPQVPGTKGWEKMYPSYFLFSDKNREQKKYEESQLWFLDNAHVPLPQFPLDIYAHEMWWVTMAQEANKTYLIPGARGIDQRVVNGYVYITPLVIEDPKEIKRREEIFHKRAGQYYMNWPEAFDKWTKNMDKSTEDLKSINFVDLPEIEPETTITSRRGYGESYTLLKEYSRFWDIVYLAWQYDFELMVLAYGAYMAFMFTAKGLFPDISAETLGRMIPVLDTKLYRPTEELQKLSKLALDLGVADAILACKKWTGVPAKLQQSDAGRKWLHEFEAARDPWFEMSTGTGWYHNDPTWNQDLDTPLSNIKSFIEALKAGKSIARPKDEVLKERDKIVGEYRSLLKKDEDRKALDGIWGLTTQIARFPEDHMWYCSHLHRSIFFQKIRDLGQIFVNHSVLKDKEDIFYLNRWEINQHLYDLVAAGVKDIKPVCSHYMPEEIARRKQFMKKFQKWTPPLALGTAPAVLNEPFTITLWGITDEKINIWLKAEKVKPEKITELKGIPASTGVAEGKARVCLTVDQLKDLKSGEILVTRITSPAWAPAFQTIVGCVTDFGGVFSHAAIVSRSFKLPAVLGTSIGTETIKTGDRIRVDGEKGIVTIIQRSSKRKP